MNLDLFSLLVLLGALQALFFGVFLLFSPAANRLQKRSLAFFILILSYNGFETLNWSVAGNSSIFRLFDFFPFVLVFGLGPALYLYVRSFNNAAVVPRAGRHYLIVLLALLFRCGIILYWLFSHNQELALKRANFATNMVELLSVCWFMVYYVLAVKEYRKLEPENTANGSWLPGEAGLVIRWLKTLLVVMLVFALAWLMAVVLPYFTNIWSGQQYYVVEILLVGIIYWIGFAGYHRTRVFYIQEQKKTRSYFDQLPKDEVDRVVNALQQAMEHDKLYLDPELNINTLASKLSILPKVLSAVLNQQLNQGFNEYVNAYRVEAVKQLITNPANHHLTITGMAYDCGFSSQPTFQRAFKQVTGQTPREYQTNSVQNPE